MRKQLHRFLSAFLCVAVLLGGVPSAFAGSTGAQSGTLGTNLTWSYDGAGNLVISGEGSMVDFSSNWDTTIPWFTYRHEILTVTVEEGVTSIGNHALHNLNNAVSVIFPSTLISIGTHSLSYLSNLEEVELPEGLNYLGDCAFDSCTKLDLTIHASFVEFGYQPFGFYWDNDAGQYGRISGATLYGLTGSSAEAYANTCGISFASIGQAAVETVKSGQLGSNLSWAFDTTGTLTISGQGAMTDFASTSDPSVPWYSLRSSISRVVVEEGVTTIGDYALHGLGSVTEVSLPSSLTSIGTHSMSYMTSLTQLTLPHGLKTLGATALGSCMALDLTVYSPDTEYVYNSFGFYWDDTSRQDALIGGVTLYGLSGSTSQTYANEHGISFHAIDLSSVSGSYRLTEEDLRTDVRGTTHIYSEEDLRKITDDLAGHYRLEADISLSGSWDVPLGTFSGTFDGNGHTISGLSVRQSDSGHYGLFSVLSGVVTDLTISGASITADSGEWIAAGILAGELKGAHIQNCTVSGTLSIQGAPTLYTGGLAGTTNNGQNTCTIEDCSTSVTITVDAASSTNYAFAGGLVADDADGVSNCTVETTITLTQSGSNPGLTAEVYGVSGSASSPCQNCTVSGDLSMNTIDAEELLVTGLYQASSSTNDCTVQATAQTGRPFAAGGAHVISCTNNGSVTVTANGKAESAFACGLYAAEGGTNNGAVSSTALAASPAAIGVDQATGDGVTNNGTVTASGGENAAATGISVASYGELLHPVNTAQVQASSRYNATSYGLIGGHYGTNSGSVTATSSDSSITETNGDHSVAFAAGILGGVFSENKGVVTGKGGYTGKAIGCRDCGESLNSAAISADGNFISQAFGLDGCTDSFNTGNTTAITEGGGLNSTADSYGHHNSSGCSSTALAYAYNDYFLFEYANETYHCESAGVRAGGSSSIHAVTPGFYSIQQSGDQTRTYFVWITKGGPTGLQDRPPTEEEVRDGLCSSHYYAFTFTTEGEPVDTWGPEEPDPPADEGGLTVTNARFYSSSSRDHLITHMRNACGSFSFDNGKEIDINDPSTTDYSTVYLQVTVANRTSQPASNSLTITLPDGFSFSKTELQETSTAAVSTVLPGEDQEVWLTVYPIYSLAYEGTTRLSCKAALGSDSPTTVPIPCVVEQMGEKSDYAKVPYTSEAGVVTKQTIHHFKYYHWDPSVFERESHLYSLSINQLSALLAQIIYESKGNAESNRIYMDALAALGFSCIETAGEPSMLTTQHLVAQKLYLDSEGNVQQLIVTSALGTVSLEGWLGNLAFTESGGYHANFKAVANSVEHTLNTYLKEYQTVSVPKRIITGHSRGGAVANLVAHQMNLAHPEQVGSIYAYTYATPHPVSKELATADKNIFNFVGYNDLVGFVPGCFTTFGNTWVFDHELNTICTKYIAPARYLSTEKVAFGEEPVRLYLVALFGVSQAGRLLTNHLMFSGYIDAMWYLDLDSCITMDAACLQIDEFYATQPEYGCAQAYEILSYVDLVKQLKKVPRTYYYSKQDAKFSYLPPLEQELQAAAEYMMEEKLEGLETTLHREALSTVLDAQKDLTFQVNCPVDVVVYDAEGTKIAEIKDDSILSGSEYLTLAVVGDHKTIWFHQDGDFTFEITGYRTGTMDCQFLAHDDAGSPTGAQNYYQLPVSTTETITAVYRNGVFSLTDNNSQVIPPDLTLAGEELGSVTLSFDCEEQAAVAMGDGQYTIGQCATVIALGTDEEQMFLGWYNGDQLVSAQAVASIPCMEDMTLTPKFGSPDELPDSILSAELTDSGITASLRSEGANVLAAAAYSSAGQMLWMEYRAAESGTVHLSIPETALADTQRAALFLLDAEDRTPVCAIKEIAK